MGATLPYSLKNTNQDVLDFFDQRFDELYDGLKQMSLASMAANRSVNIPPGVFTFPIEFCRSKILCGHSLPPCSKKILFNSSQSSEAFI